MKKKKNKKSGRGSPGREREGALRRKRLEENVPKAYKMDETARSDTDSDESVVRVPSDDEKVASPRARSAEDSGLDSDDNSVDKFDNVQVSSLLSDMEKLREEMIKKNEYEKLKEKCRRLAEDDE